MKLSAAIFFSAIAAFGAVDDILICFSSTGPDRYSDGSEVADGEIYALVWSPAGRTFGGFNADGTLVSGNDRLILAASLAKDGKCQDTLFQVDARKYGDFLDGNWAVCLVDTRRADGIPAGISEKGVVRANAWGAIRVTPSTAVKFSPADITAETGVTASVASEVPEYVPQPLITSIFVFKDRVKLTVSRAVPCITYTIASGCSMKKLVQDPTATKVDGEEGEISLSAGFSGKCKLYKVVREK